MLRSLTFAPASPAHGDGPRDIIRSTLHAYWEGIRARPAEHLVTYELTQYALREPGLADVARRQYRHYLQANVDHLEAIAELAGIHWTVEVPVLARYGLNFLDGLTLNWLIDRDDTQALAALDAYADHLAGVAAPGRPGTPA
ncbi:TetR family transcriptional regulator C-terminal domain-containing protein [Streptomyces sp. SBR177]